ncbi:MAG TPA: AI-2E family transporter [Terriglobia bacterium]|nr:AI-2E family transporter [Terriglobia bacterium]
MFGINDRAARTTWTVFLVLLAVAIVYSIKETLFLFIISLLFAYLLWPLVNILNRRLPGKSRNLALAIVYVIVIGLLFFGLFEIGSQVAAEAGALLNRLPDLLAKLQHPPPAAAEHPNSLKYTVLAELQRLVSEHSQQIISAIPHLAVKAVSAARDLIFVVLVPILAFFFLKDGDQMEELILGLFPEGFRRKQLQEIGADLHVMLAQYVRALVVLAAIAFGAYAAFFSLIGVPYAILLAAIDFPLEFIPIVGPFVAFVIIMLVAALSGFHHLLVLLAFIGLFRLAQDYMMQPHIMSAEMTMHPLIIIFGVLAGAEIGGVLGSFISIPALAVLRIVYLHLRKRRVVLTREVIAPPRL